MFKIVLIVLGILYFISPIDLIPDVIPILGKVDDLLVLLWIYWNYFRKAAREREGADTYWEAAGTHRNSRSSNDAHGTQEGHKSHGTRGYNAPKNHDPYRILEISPEAGPDEIKQAYRRQANRYHPDKVAHLGQEFQELAREKFHEIQWAYEELMRRRGDTVH